VNLKVNEQNEWHEQKSNRAGGKPKPERGLPVPEAGLHTSASILHVLPPSSRFRSCTSFSAASFPCPSSCATLLETVAQSVASLSLIIACGALGAHANNFYAALLVTGSLMCRFESLHCFHTFTAVSLLGTALREEDRCLLRLPAAVLQITD